MNTIEKAIEIFQLKVKEKLAVSNSFSSKVVKLILVDETCVILKIPYNKTKLVREYQTLNKVKKVLPVPEVLGYWKGDQEHVGALLLSYIDGKPIEGKISDTLAYELGALLGQIHRIPMSNYSLLDNPSQDWWDSIHKKFLIWIDECKGFVDDDFLKSSQKSLLDRLSIIDETHDPVLVHLDFRPGNILIKDNHIVGLIDFESARGGIPSIDFTKLKVYIWDQYPELKNYILQGYASVNTVPELDKALEVYEIFNGIGGLAWCVRRNKLEDEFFTENYEQVKRYL